MIGNRHAIAIYYLGWAALCIACAGLLIAAAEREVEKARRAELDDRKTVFAELERLEGERDLWKSTATKLGLELDKARQEQHAAREPAES